MSDPMTDLVGNLVSDPSTDALEVLGPPTPAPSAVKASLHWRLFDLLSTYLPLVLMSLLALGTWWLANNSPLAGPGRVAAPIRHEADYTMQKFTVQRFTAEGPIKAQIEGEELRHFPDTDTLEIDQVRLRSIAPDGRVTLATARRALSNGDGSEVQLMGGARVVRESTATEEAIEFRGEFLQAYLNAERVKSHLPVTLVRGKTEIRADSMDYDNLERVVNLKGKVKAVFPPSPLRRTR